MKPTFLTKKQREEQALERLNAKRSEEDVKKKEEEDAHKAFITGKTIDDRKRAERQRREDDERERKMRCKDQSKETVEHENEVKAIREHYLGGAEKKRKISKPSEKFSRIFQFDWEADDDTSKNDLNPLYSNRVQINALFGRGYVAGVDQKEQRKNSNYLLTLSEKRLEESMRGEEEHLTEDEKRKRARARDLATREFKERQLADNKARDKMEDRRMGRHWTDKELSAMTERDWRIFREDFDIRIQGGRATLPLRYWSEANFPAAVMKAITAVGYEKPSPIQRQSIPIGMAMRDIIGIAETGSGKTAAFIIPLICYMIQLPKRLIGRCDDEGPLAIVMAPTRELAQQIDEECQKLCRYTDYETCVVVGGQSIEDQGFKLRSGVEIVIGTPGRMVDCLESSFMVLNQCNYVVLDEADRMVDMGFEPQVIKVLDAMGGLLKSEDEEQAELQLQQALLTKAEDDSSSSTTTATGAEPTLYRVTAMFSATMPPQVEQIAKSYLRHPVCIRIGDEDTGKNKRIEQRVMFISEAQKKAQLMNLTQQLSKTDKCIVFVNSKKQGDTTAWNLEERGFDVGVLHGGKSQDQREETLDMFRNSKIQLLVATDVAGRGLDIPDVSHVFNYDCPSKIANYCHRIGRTGRAGKFGVATTFLTDSDTEVMYDLKQYLEQTNTPVPHQLAKHPSAQAAVGTRDDKGNLMGQKKDSIMFAKK